MPAILYEVYEDSTGETIGRITGAELRQAAGAGPNTPVFNATLVERFNERKAQVGEPERLRTVVAR